MRPGVPRSVACNDGCGFPKPQRAGASGGAGGFFAFDILAHDGQDTTALTYLERRGVLDGLALSGTSVQAPAYWADGDGQVMLDIARGHGLEGIVATRLTSTYHGGRRSPALIKSPLRKATSVVVCG